MINIEFRYSRIIKRNLRDSKIFKNNKELTIYSLKNTNTLKFAKKVINNVITRNKLNIKVSYEVFDDIDGFTNRLNNIKEKTLIILPSEAVVSLFILDISSILKNNLFLKNTRMFYNITYEISEYWLSRYYNKEYVYILEKYKEIEDLVFLNSKKGEKHIRGAINVIKYLKDKNIV